jgi:RNA polymerase sigma-70 factor (ECF subfamily)
MTHPASQPAQELADEFAEHRSLLFTVAYEMLGSAADAEDVVQESWVRWAAVDREAVRDARAYLVRIVTRQALNQLRTLSRRRESYVGPWLPEPLLTAPDVADDVELADSVSLAMLVVLDALSPLERAVFLLREVFGYEFAEVAAILDKGEAACRRSFSRAKLHLQAHRPRFPASRDEHRQLLSGFLRAAQTGDMAALTDVLADEVTLWADGGGKIKGAATRPVMGRDSVARFLLGTRRFWPEDSRAELAEVNGQAAVMVRSGGRAFSILTIEVEAGQIQAIRIVANPDKLARV